MGANLRPSKLSLRLEIIHLAVELIVILRPLRRVGTTYDAYDWLAALKYKTHRIDGNEAREKHALNELTTFADH